MLLDLLSRDDIFISYSRADAGIYAAGLADRLTEKKFSCFLDKLECEPNHDLSEALKRKIRNCTLFVLVGTERGAVSQFVEKEIKEFLKTGRTIVPIDFGGAVGRARWYELIPGLASEPENSSSALRDGDPSPNVVSRVEKSFNYTRRNERLLRTAWATGAVLVALIILILVAAYFAWKYVKEATFQQGKAAEATRLAGVKEGEAAKATQLAEQKGKEADAATKLAAEKAQEAERAGEQAASAKVEADRQKDAARRAADEAQRQGQRAAASARVAHERLVEMSQEQGRMELLRGNRQQALVYLNDAYAQRPRDESLLFTLAVATRALVFTFDAHDPSDGREPPAPRIDYGLGDYSSGPEVRDAAFNQDGTRVVTASEKTVKVWDPIRGELLYAFKPGRVAPGDAGYVTLARFISGGKQLLTRTGKLLSVWDAESGDFVRSLPELKEEVVTRTGRGTQLSLDARLMAVPGTSGGSGVATRVFETVSGRLKFSLAERGPLTKRFVAFSPDGRRLLNGYGVYDAEEGRLLFEFKHQGEVKSAAFSPDGKRVATGGADKMLKVWDAATGEVLSSVSFKTNIVAVAFMSNMTDTATKIAVVSGKVELVSCQVDCVRMPELESDGCNLNSNSTFLAFSPNGQRLVAGDSSYGIRDFGGEKARVWDVETRKLLEVLPGRATDAVFSPDGERVLLYGSDDEVKVWNVGKDLLLGTLRGDGGRGFSKSVAFSHDGKYLLADVDYRDVGFSTLNLWDAEHRRPLRAFDEGHALATPAAFSPDSKRVLAPGQNATVRVLDVASGRLLQRLGPHRAPVTFAAYSSDGERIVATASDSKEAKIWDARSGALLHTLADEESLSRAAFSPDGRLILTIHTSGVKGTVWDASTGTRLRLSDGAQPSFSPDGLRLLTLIKDTTPRDGRPNFTATVRKAETGELLYELPKVIFANFSPDGKQIVTTSADRTAKLWRADGGQPIRTLGGHNGDVLYAAFSADGGRLVTVDQTLKVWDVSRGQLLYTLGSPTMELGGYSWRPQFVTFSPDGKFIVSLSEVTDDRSGMIQVWDSHTETRGAGEIEQLINRWVPNDVLNTVVRQSFRSVIGGRNF